jgi:hypothetical protein
MEQIMLMLGEFRSNYHFSGVRKYRQNNFDVLFGDLFLSTQVTDE